MTEIHTDKLMDLPSLKGKTAVVTGAGSGIGKAIALLLAKQKCKVAVCARRRERVDDTAKEIEKLGGEALALKCDISSEQDVKELYAQVQKKWGDVDLVVANAGINGVWAPIEELTKDEFEKTTSINITGTFLTVKYAVPLMKKKGGSIVLTSSINGTRNFSMTGATAYSTSKAAQIAMMKMLAVELAKWKIRINAVCPGHIETNINTEQTVKRDLDKIKFPVNYPQGPIPLTGNVPGSSEQVANMMAFLLSNCADFVTGTEVWVDGAETLVKG